MPTRHILATLGLVTATLGAIPAVAQDSETIAYEPTLPVPQSAQAAPVTITRYSAEQREGWLAQCRERMRLPEGSVARTSTGQADKSWNAASYCEDYLNRYEAAYVRAIEDAYAKRSGAPRAQAANQSPNEPAPVE